MSKFSRMPRAYPDHNLPDNGEVFFAYDAVGRMTRRTDQVPDNTAYAYDRANRLTQRTYPDALNDTFTYDQASRLLTASSARYNNVVTRVYDDASRMTSETLTVGGQNFPVQSAYDAANRRTSITYPDDKIVLQTFTDRNQLSSVSYDGSNVATLAYDVGMRQTTKTFVNGKVETRTYRLDNRLTQIQTPGVTDFTYTYDANKNPLTKNFALDTSDNQTYTYDAEDRLTNFARQSGFNQNWTLTLVGDWSAFNNNGNAETRTHNNVHELTAINAGSLAYDLKGNLTSNSNGQGYTWDFENLMKSATVGADTANYEYDAFRRRVKKSFQGAATVFVYDGWRCVAEYENGASASSPARDFVFGTYLDEPLMMVTAPAGASTKRYYHTDHLYSVYALTDAGGAVVERYRYTAYGQATVLTAGFAAKTDPNYSEFGNPWTYTGQRLDAETSLHYYKNRYYSSVLGRWMSRDPVGYKGGVSLYQYVASRVTRFRDALGLVKSGDQICCFTYDWRWHDLGFKSAWDCGVHFWLKDMKWLFPIELTAGLLVGIAKVGAESGMAIAAESVAAAEATGSLPAINEAVAMVEQSLAQQADLVLAEWGFAIVTGIIIGDLWGNLNWCSQSICTKFVLPRVHTRYRKYKGGIGWLLGTGYECKTYGCPPGSVSDTFRD